MRIHSSLTSKKHQSVDDFKRVKPFRMVVVIDDGPLDFAGDYNNSSKKNHLSLSALPSFFTGTFFLLFFKPFCSYRVCGWMDGRDPVMKSNVVVLVVCFLDEYMPTIILNEKRSS